MGNPQVTEFEIGWLIGIFDGEGCYTIAKTVRHGNVSLTPSIKFVNTNFEIIEEVQMILKAFEIEHFTYNVQRSGNRKPAKRIEINGLEKIKKFFDIFFLRMRCRVDQAKVLKEFVELRLSKKQKESYTNDEYSLYSIMRELNRTGSGTSETARDPS
jgi:LAGLIDADG-like domain